jgi:hypothetical protein
MATANFHAGRGTVWPHITALVERVKRQRAAVAYIGKDAPTLLPLRAGAELFADVGTHALAQGLTNPDALQHYLDAGVTVRSLPGLHAKVMLLGGTAVIGSMNASASSAADRLEAVTITTDVQTVADVRQWLDELREHPGALEVTDEFLTVARTKYRPSKPGPKVGHALLPDGPFPLVLTWLPWHNLSPHAEDVAAKRGRSARQVTGPAARFRIGYIELGRADRDAYREGDVLIGVYDEDDEVWVAPPVTVVLVERIPGRSGQLVFTREDVTLDPLTYAELRAYAPTLPSTPPDERRIRPEGALREQILAAWNLP